MLFAVLCVQCSPPFADLLRAAECGCSVRNQGAVHYPSLSSVKQSNDVKIDPIINKQYNELMTPTRVIIKAYEHNTDIFNWIWIIHSVGCSLITSWPRRRCCGERWSLLAIFVIVDICGDCDVPGPMCHILCIQHSSGPSICPQISGGPRAGQNKLFSQKILKCVNPIKSGK